VTLHIPGTTKLASAREPTSAQCPGSLFEQATFLFLEGVVLILYRQRLGQNREEMYRQRLGQNREEMLARHANVE